MNTNIDDFFLKYMKALVVGYGSIGKRHIENLSKLKNMKIIVCTKRKPDKFLKDKKCIVHDSLAQCLKKNPDLAIIANETRFHLKTAMILANAGIHMMIEKPLSHSLTGTIKLNQISKKKKLIVTIGCNFRFHPSLILIKKLISDGTIGKIISARIENGSYLPDWHPYENYKKNYAARNDLGGGVVLTCIHEIDTLYWFFGNIQNVFSVTGKFSQLKISADDLSAIILKFKNNIVAEAHLDYFQQPSSRNCKIIGSKGTISWDIKSNTVRYFDIKSKRWITKYSSPNYNINKSYIDELNHFINCISTNYKPINTLDEGIYTLKIALAVNQSSKNKKLIEIDKQN